MNIQLPLRIFAIVLLGAISVPLTAAQLDPPSAQQPGQQTQTYSDADLKTFAEALVEVERITDEYQPRLEAAKNLGEEEQVRQAAFKEATTVLAQKGMSIDKYKEILVVAQNDPDVAQRIREQIKKLL